MAVPESSTRSPVGLVADGPTVLLTWKSRVLIPGRKPNEIVKGVKTLYELRGVVWPVATPLIRMLMPWLSAVHRPLICAVAGFRPVKLKVVRYV